MHVAPDLINPSEALIGGKVQIGKENLCRPQHFDFFRLRCRLPRPALLAWRA
jgi:hypothetical protein